MYTNVHIRNTYVYSELLVTLEKCVCLLNLLLAILLHAAKLFLHHKIVKRM